MKSTSGKGGLGLAMGIKASGMTRGQVRKRLATKLGNKRPADPNADQSAVVDGALMTEIENELKKG